MPDTSEIGALVGRITSDVAGIARAEAELFKEAELKPWWEVTKRRLLFFAVGLVAALLVGVLLATVLTTAIARSLNEAAGWPVWSAVIWGATLALIPFLILAAIFGGLGWVRLKRQVKSLKIPDEARTTARQAVEAIKDGFAQGQVQVDGGAHSERAPRRVFTKSN